MRQPATEGSPGQRGCDPRPGPTTSPVWLGSGILFRGFAADGPDLHGFILTQGSVFDRNLTCRRGPIRSVPEERRKKLAEFGHGLTYCMQ